MQPFSLNLAGVLRLHCSRNTSCWTASYSQWRASVSSLQKLLVLHIIGTRLVFINCFIQYLSGSYCFQSNDLSHQHKKREKGSPCKVSRCSTMSRSINWCSPCHVQVKQSHDYDPRSLKAGIDPDGQGAWKTWSGHSSSICCCSGSAVSDRIFVGSLEAALTSSVE